VTSVCLPTVLRDHAAWIANNGGKRADLSGADLRGAHLSCTDLSGADLSGADLRGACLCHTNLRGADLREAELRGIKINFSTGNGREIKSLDTGRWPVVISPHYMAIGCRQHDIDEWLEFDDDAIDAMDANALEWWRIWRPVIKAWIEAAGEA
jgi:hypothetical protein